MLPGGGLLAWWLWGCHFDAVRVH